MTRAPAITTRCRCPPEISWGYREKNRSGGRIPCLVVPIDCDEERLGIDPDRITGFVDLPDGASLRRNHPDVSFPDVGDVVAVRRPGRGGVLPEGRELAMGGETGGMPTGDREDPDVGHVPIQDEGDGRPVGRDGQVVRPFHRGNRLQ